MHSFDRVLRYPGIDELAAAVAERLVDRILALEATQDTVNVCISASAIAPPLHDALARHPRIGSIDPARFHLWWGNENFVDATDPRRHSTHTLSQLHNTLPLLAAHAHTMPQRSGSADPDEAAYAYAQEIDGTVFDLCLFNLGEDGHVAGIYPRHPSLETAQDPGVLVMGVLDAPVGAPDQISVTFKTINAARQVWLLACGPDRAAALAASLAGEGLPASFLQPAEGTIWIVDEPAAADLPTFQCSL